jgi:type II secretory pathway component HofQ
MTAVISGCTAGPPESPAPGSQRITVNFKEADVSTALDLIARLSDLNILADPGLAGTVTLAKNNVTAREVLDDVVAACGLRLTRHESGVLRVSAD